MSLSGQSHTLREDSAPRVQRGFLCRASIVYRASARRDSGSLAGENCDVAYAVVIELLLATPSISSFTNELAVLRRQS
jgi:hypothetical protein